MTAKFKFSVRSEKILTDTVTPVGIYMKLRDVFPGGVLLESADYRGSENSYSYIGLGRLATFTVDSAEVIEALPDGTESRGKIAGSVPDLLTAFIAKFSVRDEEHSGVTHGIFGHTSYDAVRLFEDIEIKAEADAARHIPELSYSFFEFILAINHFKNEMRLVQYVPEFPRARTSGRQISEIRDIIFNGVAGRYPFKSDGEELSNFSDEEFAAVIRSCQKHIMRGDVFQIVPSRRFSTGYSGDEFNVYRALRSINPSPYLFFFDCGGYKIFGSSPEAQITIKDGTAAIYPIAGTYQRRGPESEDLRRAEELRNDPKENAEHVMLVDLARNDLSKHCRDVRVESFKEIQFYSHVIHLVSKVAGAMKAGASAVHVLADTFPAGTLSGAPKHRAMQLIDGFERGRRYFYGGCIGMFSLDGQCNHAITIRSFCSRGNRLYYQAGAGVVMDSVPESEVAEVKNKLLALKKAIAMGEQLA